MEKMLTLTIILTINICLGQTEMIYFNIDWKPCEKTEAKYYRTILKNKDEFIVSDFYINDKPQMIAICTNSTDPLNKNGKCIYFDENGIKESQGVFENNKSVGRWVWYDNNGNDSTIATYLENGTKNYSRFSKIETDNQKTSNEVYQIVEEMPHFSGGVQEMYKFISKEFNIPKVDKQNNIKGTFYVGIIVDEVGSISITEIKKSLSPTLDEEAKRVVNKMPAWVPGRQKNRLVKVLTIIPFKIN